MCVNEVHSLQTIFFTFSDPEIIPMEENQSENKSHVKRAASVNSEYISTGKLFQGSQNQPYKTLDSDKAKKSMETVVEEPIYEDIADSKSKGDMETKNLMADPRVENIYVNPHNGKSKKSTNERGTVGHEGNIYGNFQNDPEDEPLYENQTSFGMSAGEHPYENESNLQTMAYESENNLYCN